jgi:hypothetical protein
MKITMACIQLLKYTSVIHNRFDLPIIFPLALGSIHSKRTGELYIVYIIYMWRTLHYPELSLQSKGGPPLHYILHLYCTLIHGANRNCIFSILPSHILTSIDR